MSLSVGCSGGNREAEPVATGTLAVTVGPRVGLLKLDYTILRDGVVMAAGTVDVSPPDASISLEAHLPAGLGYLIRFDGTATDDVTTCRGQAGFDVVAGATTSLGVVLTCQRPDPNGSLSVVATINQCPRIVAHRVSPVATGVGSRIELAGAAVDPDCPSLTYKWTTSGSGLFGNPMAAGTTFTCHAPGRENLTLTVSDATCTTSVSTQVTCNATGTTPPCAFDQAYAIHWGTTWPSFTTYKAILTPPLGITVSSNWRTGPCPRRGQAYL